MKTPFVVVMALVLLLAAEAVVSLSMKSLGDELGNVMENTNVLVRSPKIDSYISSPVAVSGQARGTWFFEGSFPIDIVSWDGEIIGQGYAQATKEWMTEGFVPFVSEVKFARPRAITPGTYNENGSIILRRSNPSGLVANEASVEIPIRFR